MWRRFFLSAALAGAVALAACSPDTAGDPDNPENSADSAQQNVESAGMVDSDTLPDEANATDVHFLGMMVPHHEQAIEMSDVLLASDVDDARVRDLAQRIRDGQTRENEIMENWATKWGQQQAMELHSHHIANGMLNPTMMNDFKQLTGDELRTKFLEYMYIHHADVIAMTQDQVENGGYQPLVDLAEDMIEVQTAEMDEMEQLLGYTPSA